MSAPSANRPPDPSPIFQLATGYWASATLLAASELGLFGALTEGAKSTTDTAAALKTDVRATGLLLDACAGLGLLQKVDGTYALTPLAAAFLVPGRPGYLGSALRWSADQYPAWGQLAEATRTGRPAVDPDAHLGDDPAQTRAFVVGMHERARGVARGVVPFLTLDEDARTLLDVGGGPGTYATLLAQQHPQLQVTVLDLPGIVSVAQDLVAASGVGDRVHFLAGDATSGEYGGEHYDAVLFSGVLHQMSPATIQLMLAGAHRALKPNRPVLISDMMLAPEKTQPVFSTLFSLQMLLTTLEGAVFSAAECEAWLQATGFGQIESRPLPPPLPYTMIRARKT